MASRIYILSVKRFEGFFVVVCLFVFYSRNCFEAFKNITKFRVFLFFSGEADLKK